MESRIIVVRVTGEDDTTGTFKRFTNRVVGRGLLIPDNNEVFFGYRESHGGKSVSTMIAVIVYSHVSQEMKFTIL